MCSQIVERYRSFPISSQFLMLQYASSQPTQPALYDCSYVPATFCTIDDNSAFTDFHTKLQNYSAPSPKTQSRQRGMKPQRINTASSVYSGTCSRLTAVVYFNLPRPLQRQLQYVSLQCSSAWCGAGISDCAHHDLVHRPHD